MKYEKIILKDFFKDCKDGYLELYLHEDDSSKPLVIICPGGGYDHVSLREGRVVAEKFFAFCFNAAVLTYTVGYNCYPYPMKELESSIKYLSDNKSNYKISDISLMGFSAGGHLAAYVGYTTKQKISNIILGYPVITLGKFTHTRSRSNLLGDNEKLYDLFSVEKLVNPNSPRTFIYTTVSDESVPFENTLSLIEALRKNKVSFELHAYEMGPHGISLATEEVETETIKKDEVIATWIYFLEKFLKRM